MQCSDDRFHIMYTSTYLSVFKNKQPGVTIRPWRKLNMVYHFPILLHTKFEPCKTINSTQVKHTLHTHTNTDILSLLTRNSGK